MIIKEKKEECGIIGIINRDSKINTVALTATTLQSLQHRGEEAAGITAGNGKKISGIFGQGKVQDVFEGHSFKEFDDHFIAIGHNRYSVTGSKNQKNIQPLLVNHFKGQFAVAHNGNLTNSIELKKNLEKQGAIFQTSMDSEIFTHLIAKSKKIDFESSLVDVIKKIEGSFSLLLMTQNKIYAVRDRHGFRPLCWGIVNGIQIIASETCALDLIGAKYMGQIHPGEMAIFSRNRKPVTKQILKSWKHSKCIFELIYFSRPDSLVFGESVYQFRKKSGQILAEESPIDADLVIPIPDSGVYAAIGYSQASGIPFEMAITKNHYIGRSFIQPSQALRDHHVKMKLNPIKNMIHKKSIVLVDDSIVRGTTTKHKIKALRDVGAKEIHMRVAAPPIKHPCFYGIDFPDKQNLIANQKNLEETKKFLGLDSLSYLSIDGLKKASNSVHTKDFCTACFSGKYPTKIPRAFNKNIFEY